MRKCEVTLPAQMAKLPKGFFWRVSTVKTSSYHDFINLTLDLRKRGRLFGSKSMISGTVISYWRGTETDMALASTALIRESQTLFGEYENSRNTAANTRAICGDYPPKKL